jgi:hypothetical protein
MHGLTVQSHIRGMGEYRQFVANPVIKIQAHSIIEWHHVPTSENSADIGSRGGQPTEKWLNGPTWLGNEMKWPESLGPMHPQNHSLKPRQLEKC